MQWVMHNVQIAEPTYIAAQLGTGVRGRKSAYVIFPYLELCLIQRPSKFQN